MQLIQRQHKRFLRRTLTPYVGQVSIVLGVVVFVSVVAAMTGQWQMLIAIAVILIPFGYLIFVGMKYRIYWTDMAVCQVASGGADVCINLPEIREVAYEIAGPKEMSAMPRPYRRIAIYAFQDDAQNDTNIVAGHKKSRFVDVSLRHFDLDDIAALFEYIKEWRPDLTLPALPKRKSR